MTPKLKELLEKHRKARANSIEESDAPIIVQTDTSDDKPRLILVPAFDCIVEDEFSEYF